MGLGKTLKKLKKIADPIGTAAERKTNQVLGLSSKKSSSSAAKPAASSPTSRGSAGGTGPQTQDFGAQRATVNGSDAMAQSRGLSAGARSGVGRLQKAGYSVK